MDHHIDLGRGWGERIVDPSHPLDQAWKYYPELPPFASLVGNQSDDHVVFV